MIKCINTSTHATTSTTASTHATTSTTATTTTHEHAGRKKPELPATQNTIRELSARGGAGGCSL